MRILPRNGEITDGAIWFADPRRGGEPVDLTELPADGPEIRALRGGQISIIFQEPMSSLSPLHTIGDQVSEALRLHREVGTAEARELTQDMLRLVGFPDPPRAWRSYPFELSGGLRQRAMIAMALVCRPSLLIADEPTTALDVTIQAQILALMLELQQELGMGLILITHDLGVVAQTAQRVIVMYAGRKVEEADVETLFADPRHPYTRGLMASIPAVPSLQGNADVRLAEIPGTVPSLTRLPKGCAFAPRCSLAMTRCREEYPPLQEFGGGGSHLAACWRAVEMTDLP
jgi:peptide/nickel transport system ATP-binding protein